MSADARLRLGEKPSGETLWVPFSQLLRHTLVVGVTGTGKSSWLEDLLISLIGLMETGQPLGIGVLDPVGEVFAAMRSYLASLSLRWLVAEQAAAPAMRPMIRRRRERFFSKVVLLDFTDQDCGGWRFNPLERRAGMSTAETVGDFLRVLERIVGDLTEMRRLQTVLRCILSVLVETGGTTLRDAVDLLCLDTETFEEYLDRLAERRRSGRLRFDPRPSIVEVYLRELFASSSQRERRELISSTMHVLNVFLADETVACFFSSPRSNLDLEAVVNDGGILLVLAPAGLDLNTQRVPGALLANRIELICRRRKVPEVKAGKHPVFVLMVDEFQTFVGTAWRETFAQLRNYGLCLIVSHQTRAQIEDSVEGQALYKAVQANTAIQVYFRLGLDPDAKEAAHLVFRPQGKMKKREALDESLGISRSWSEAQARSQSQSLSRSEGGSESLSLTLTAGKTGSVSFTKAEGQTRVETQSLSIAVGDSWSSCISKTTGVSITQTASETFVQGGGQAQGEAVTESESESSGTSDSSSGGNFEGQGLSLAVGWDPALGAATGKLAHRSSSQGGSDSRSSGRSYQVARSLAQAVSSVVSTAESLAQGSSQAYGKSRSKSVSATVGGSRTSTEGQSLAKGLSLVESCCKSLGRSLSEARGTTQTRSWTKARSHSQGRTQTQTKAGSASKNITRRTELYSVQEEIQLRAYELASLPPRHAWILLNGVEACRVRTHDVPQVFPSRLGSLDGEAAMLRLCQPPPGAKEPRLPVQDRLARRMLAQKTRGARNSTPGKGQGAR